MKPRVLSAPRLTLPLAMAIATLFSASQAFSQIVWNGATANVANGAWGTATNWVGSNIPDNDTEVASFSKDWSGTGPTFALGADRTVNGVIYNDTGASADQAGTIVAGSTLTFGGTTPTITTTNSLTIASVVSWGAAGLTKAGPVTLTLSGANTGTGPLTLSAGIIRATTSASALGTGTAAVSIAGSTTLQLANDTGLSFGRNTTITGTGSTITADRLNAAATSTTHTLGTLAIGAHTLNITRGASITGAGVGGITFGAATLSGNATFTPAADSLLTLSSTTGLSTFSLTKSGAGSMTATGVVSGTGTGTILSVSAGTLSLGSTANTFSGNISIAGATSVLSITGVSGGGFTTSSPLGNQASNYKTVTLTNGGTFRLASSNYNVNVPNASSQGAGQVFSIGTGGGTFDVASGSAFTLDDGTGAAGTAWTAPQLQGSGALTKTGTGTLALGAGSSNFGTAFTGTITVNAGLLQLGNAGSPLGNATAGTTIASGAALNVNGTTQTAAEPLTLTGTGLASGPQGALTNSSATAATWAGPVTLSGAATIGSSNAGGLTLGSAATVNTDGNILTLRITGTGRIFTDGIVSGNGSMVMNSSGSGDYVPRADHTYTGGTTHTAGFIAVDRASVGSPGSLTSGPFGTGTLELAGGQIRSGTGSARSFGNAVTISADTTFYTIGSEKSLTFAGPVTLSGGNRVLTANVGTTVANTATIMSGPIGDGGNALGLTMAGTGNLILGGANTYTGATAANSGRLILTGSLNPASALSVSPTVAGGAVFSLGSGTANPVSSSAALTLGSATGPTTLGFDLGPNTAGSDSINTSAAATTTGTVNLAIQALAGFGSSSSYDLITAGSGLGGATYALTSAPGGYTYSLSTSASLVSLNVNPTTAGDLYWRGDSGNSWSAFNGSNTNWFSDAAGSTNAQANPGAGDTVNFSTVNATNTGGVITTSLDNNFTVNDLVFGNNPNGVSSVTIAGGTTPAGSAGVLAIAPGVSSDGIVVGSNAGNVTLSAPVLLGASQTWAVDGTGVNGSSLTVSGAVSGSGSLGVGGLVTLSAPGTSTYSGATTVPNGGILQGGATNSFSPSSALTVSGTGIVRLNGFSNTVAAFAGDGTVQNNHASTGATLTVGDAANTTFSGVLQNGAGGTLGLTKNGTGSLTLSGANTHTGTTTVNAGTLIFGSATALTANNPVTLAGTGALDINGFSVSTGAISAAVATSTITNSSTSTSPSTATALYTPSGAGVYVDAITSASGGTLAALITDGPVRKTQVAISNANSNAQLSNDSNTFSGGLVLLDNPSGTRFSINTAIAGNRLGTGPLIIGQSPTDRAGIYFSAVDNTVSLPIIVNTGLGSDRFGFRNDGRAITLSGVITANSDVVFTSNLAAASNTVLTNKVTGPGGLVVDLSQTSTANTLHTVTLNTTANANDYAGNTEIGRTNVAPAQNYAATLALGASDQIPNGSGKGNVIITNNSGTRTGTLRLAGFSDTINGLSGNGNVDAVSGSPTLTLGDNNTSATFSGNLLNGSGTLTVTKIGTGTQTFSGASTFTGALNVTGGLVAFATSPATAGPLGNSTVVNLNGGGISFTPAGANNLNRPIAIGASAGTVDVANATGALTIAATSTGGDLVKTGSGSALIPGSTQLNVSSNGAGVAVNGGTLQAGFGGTDVATVSVGATGNLDLRDSAAEALVLENSSGALSLADGAQVGFELIGAGNDSISTASGGTALVSGTVTLNFFGTPAAGTYNLLAADSGLAAATYALGTAPNGFNYTINVTDSLVSVTVSAYTPTYWRGGQDFSWNTLGAATANWTTDAGGTADASSTPLSADTVLFSAAGAPFSSGSVIDTTLDAAFTVDSLQFTNVPAGVTAVSIAPGSGGSLTLSPLSTSGGVRVLAGGGNATISAPLTVSAAQTWDVDPSGSLTVSGNTAFNANVTKSNTGALTLAGTNSGSGAFTLAGGSLHLNSGAALGSGLLTIGAGTTLNAATGAITLGTNNVQTWGGDFTFTGTNPLDLGTGAVTLGASLAVNTPGATLTVGGIIGDGGNNRGLSKTGAGTLVLNGANSYTGPTSITGGVLRISQSTGLGTSAGGVTQSGTSALELDGTSGAISVGAEPLTINGGGITNLGALRNIAGDNTYGGTVTMAAQSRINSDSGTLTLSHPTSVSATNLTLVVGGAGNLTISGAVATGTGGVNKADGAGTLTLAGTNTYTGATTVSAGTLTLTSGASITPTGNVVALNVSGATAVANIAGTYNSSGGAGIAVNSGGILNTSGTLTFSGSGSQALLLGTSGGDGTWNVTGGSVSINFPANGIGLGNGGIGTLNVSAGSVTTPGANVLNLGHAANGTGNLNISGTGLVTISAGSGLFRVGNNATATATVNLNGGTLALGRNVSTVAGAVSTFNFNGGLLRAGLTSTTYLQGITRANVRDGGALIDTNGFNVTIGQALLHSDIGGDLTVDGGLTKSGLGTLTLSGANNYNGPTLVSGGALVLNGSAATGTLTTSSVTVGAAGSLGFTTGSASTLDLTGKDLTLSGGTLAFDIGDAGVNDAINVNNFTLSANSALSLTGIGAIGGTYTLLTSSNPISNAGSYTLTGQTIGRVTLTPTVNSHTITIDSTVFEGKWNQAGGGNWSLGDPGMTQDNWDNYKPTVAGDAALFGDSITAPSTVLVDTPHIAGYLRFDNANAYTIGANGSSNLTLNNGASNAVATVTTGSHTIAENVVLLSHLDVIPAAGSTLTHSGVLSGSAKNLELNGPGALVLSGANTYNGSTTVSRGTLTLSGARTATMGAITVGNLPSTTGTLNIGNGSFTTGTFSVGSGTNALTAGIVNHTGGTLTMSGNQLLLGNGGTGVTAGSNSTGTYNLNGGTLNTVAGGIGVLIGTNTGATGVFNMMSGTLNMAATSTMQIARSDNNAALATTGSFIQTGGTATVGILQMSGTSAGAVNNANGSSTLTLTGGTFSAATFNALSGGNQSTSAITIGGTAQVTLPVFPTNVKGTSSTATITFDSTTGFLSPAATSATYLPAGTFTNAYLTANGANLNIPSGRDITIAQVFGDAPTFAGTLKKSGVGVLTLSSANTYTGTSLVSEGTLALGHVDGLGSTTAGTTVASGGRVIFGGLATSSTVAEAFDITGSGIASNGALNVGGNKSITLSGAITMSGDASITVDGGSAFNITNTNAITGVDTDLTFQADSGATSTISGAVNLGTGSLTKTGGATLILSGDNTYSGGTFVTGGILSIPSSGDAGSGAISILGAVRLELGALTLANAINLGANASSTGRGLVEGTNGVTTLSGPVSITIPPTAGGTFATSGAGTLLNVNGAITATPATVPVSVRAGNVNFGGGGNYTDLRISGNVGLNATNGISTSAVITAGASVNCVVDLKGFNQSLAGMIKGGSAASVVNSTASTTSTLTLTNTATSTNSVVLSGTGAGTLAVTQAGTAIQTLSGVNTYTGPTTVTSGTLAAGVASVANVSGAFGKNSAVILADNATAALDITGFNTQIGSLTGGGASGGNVNLGAATLTVGGDNTSPAAYSGSISGTGALTKIGTGTQTLSGANTYSGNTTVSAGTLALIGGSHASPVSVNSGASLGFTLGSPTSSTSTFNLSSGTIKITGTPTLPSYTLISSSTGITGTPTLDAPIAGYVLKKVGNTLVLENPYEAWAAANGATGGQSGDPDGDGYNNLMEFAFGTDPTVNSAGSISYSGGVVTATGQPVLEVDGGIYYAVFGRRVDYQAAGLTYTVEFSNALSSWTPTTAVPTVIATDGVIEAVRVPFLNFVPSDSGPQKPTFFRVGVSQ